METDLVTITPEQVTPEMLAMFEITKPTMPRAFQVLEGITRGHSLVDHPEQRTTAVVRDGIYGTLYFGGDINATRLATFVPAPTSSPPAKRGGTEPGGAVQSKTHHP